jgi:hypothetical protein
MICESMLARAEHAHEKLQTRNRVHACIAAAAGAAARYAAAFCTANRQLKRHQCQNDCLVGSRCLCVAGHALLLDMHPLQV